MLKTLDEFQFTAIPSLNRRTVLELAQGNYIQAKENAVFLGPTGTGKTPLAVSLGLAACRPGHRVRFAITSGQSLGGRSRIEVGILEPYAKIMCAMADPQGSPSHLEVPSESRSGTAVQRPVKL